MGKLTGYIIMLLGLALIVLSLFFKEFTAKIPLISSLETLWVIIIGTTLLILGFFFSKKKTHSSAEVPIYKGNKIIGYRKR